MNAPQFENYHCHTHRSNPLTILDSTVSIGDYAKVYAQRGMQCLVASEHGYRGDVWEQADEAAKYPGMKAICGAEPYFVPNRDPDLKDGRNFHLILLAKDNVGFRQLNKALSIAQMTGYYKAGRLDFELLSSLDYRHFLCTTACIGGVLRDPEGERMACQLAEIFKDNFRLEVQYHCNEKQIAHNQKVLRLYQKYRWPLIFATDSHYIDPSQKILRKELQLSGNIEIDDSDWDLSLPTPEEAYASLLRQNVFSRSQIEESFENTLELRDWEGFSYTTERKLPVSRPRQSLSNEQRKRLYQKMVCDGYIAKFGMPSPDQAAQLREEMNVILDTDSEDYFISLKDMLDRGVELGGVLTTTARGSAGSFATNCALGFTTINRLTAPVSMFPERFISADKLKAGNPDIDSNITNVEAFEQAGKEMFGEFGCLPMVAFGTNKVSSAFKMLARARDLDFELADKISKQIKDYEMDKKRAEEANADDPDYDVDEDVCLSDYIAPEYRQLVEDSRRYQGIIVNVSPHPCAHLTYNADLREEIGVVRVKAKSGNKEPKYCVYIDGARADQLNYVKSDLLRVDVVKQIAETFAAVGQPVMPVDELLAKIRDDPKVWNLYWSGATQCLNQCERAASTQKIMRFKPRNIVELTAFIASIRPGFKSMVETFISRTPFNYGIKSLDDLLKIPGMTGATAQSSFLLFDEQILKILIAGGIPGPEAYATIKHIKKKHKDKVLEEKEKFKTGFTKYLKETEGASDELAADVVERIWTIIEDSSSYLFCAAHAYAMACDSLYGAYLKAYHPYEFYSTILRLYTEKGNKDKVAAIIREMQTVFGIRLTTARFGQDNRGWFCDKEHRAISQSLASVKFMSPAVGQALYEVSGKSFPTFADCLRHLHMETCLNTRQIEILIGIGYFAPFGGSAHLMRIFRLYFGKDEPSSGVPVCLKNKNLKSWEQRMEALRAFESSDLADEELPALERVGFECVHTGLCFTRSSQDVGKYFVTDIDDKYRITLTLYNVCSGTESPPIRMKKADYEKKPVKKGDCLFLWRDSISERPRYTYHDGERAIVPGVKDYWLKDFRFIAHAADEKAVA